MVRGRIGLFGGTFDPPHLAHLAVAEVVRDRAGLDRVIWMPAASSPFKSAEPATPARHRLEMVRRAVSGNDSFEVSDLEITRDGVSYTVDTVKELADHFPEARLHLILGGDALRTFAEWRRPKEIVELAHILAYRRPGDELEEADLPDWLAARVEFVEAPGLDLSATRLRQMLREGRSVRYLVPDAVLDYITREDLYG